MSSVAKTRLLEALNSVSGTGVFCTAASTPFFMPEMRVKGVGGIAFPLSAAQAAELRRHAEAAPYGKGTRTLTDDKVRKCWQIDATRVHFDSAEWHEYVARTTAEAAKALGVTGKVAADPYKLLLYEKGGHFLPHRDTEKLDAMFGTLIIALPSAHTGGTLRVRHGGESVAIDFSRRDRRSRFQSAAFFADCEHEVEPVQSGYRFCLVYTLRLVKGRASQIQRSLDDQAARLIPALRKFPWKSAPSPAVVLLEHRYTEANFSRARLKGNDGARARALMAAADQAGLVAHLALVTYYKLGDWPDGYDDGYSSRWRSDRFRRSEPRKRASEMGEVYEESLVATHWRDTRDAADPIGSVRLEEDWLVAPPGVFEDEPDDSESEGYTGNAGCTMEYWYRRAAVVLWPQQDHASTLCALNFPSACHQLYRDSKKTRLRQSPGFQRLLREVIQRLPDNLPSTGTSTLPFRITAAGLLDHQESSQPNILQQVLGTLAHTKDLQALRSLAAELPPASYALYDAATWKQLVEAFGVEPLRPMMEMALDVESTPGRSSAFILLEGLILGECNTQIPSVALQLAALPPAPPAATWPRIPNVPPGDPREITLMLNASRWVTHQPDAEKLADFVLGDRSLPYLREKFLPALEAWRKDGITARKLVDGAPHVALAAAISIFEKEIERPLSPFPDWTRPCPLPSNERRTDWPFRESRRTQDPLRQELQAFMADPDARQHTFARPQADREDIEALIRDAELDLNTETLRTGTPHKLVCTKNSASHERALIQRTKDIAHLKQLRRFLP